MEDFAIRLCVLFSSLVLRSFIRIFFVTNRIQVWEGFSLYRCEESLCVLWNCRERNTVIHMFKFWLSHELVRPTENEGLFLNALRPHGAGHASCSKSPRSWLAQVILTRVDVRVCRGIALQPLKRFFDRADWHALSCSDLIFFFAECFFWQFLGYFPLRKKRRRKKILPPPPEVRRAPDPHRRIT